MSRLQKGFVQFVIPLIIAGLAWGGVISYAVVNAEKHPEISKPGRS